MAKKKIFILGAGLAGLSAAWHLQKRGRDCQVLEKEAEAGGLCRSKKIGGFTFDCDGHILHFRRRYAFDFIKGLLGDNLQEHQRSAWIYSHGRYTRYPFQANLYGLPPRIIKECLLGLVEASRNGDLKNKDNPAFLDWINCTFGKGIARYFMVPYNTKFWTVSPEELNCEWLNPFIPVPSLSDTIEGTIEESARQFGYSARFWYPKKGGINQLSQALASEVKNIYTNSPITQIDLERQELKTASGNKEKFDFLISTIPLPEMGHLIKNLPQEIKVSFKKLNWNSIFNINFGIERSDSGEKHWIYFPEREIRFFRIGFFHNFSSCLAPTGSSSLYIEISYSEASPIDKENIASFIKEDLQKVGILKKEDRILAQDINDIKYGYPIYDRNYSRAREDILNYLCAKRIMPAGRYGSWRYFSMEDAIMDGATATARL